MELVAVTMMFASFMSDFNSSATSEFGLGGMGAWGDDDKDEELERSGSCLASNLTCLPLSWEGNRVWREARREVSRVLRVRL